MTVRAPSHGPSGGVAYTLDEAKAAFRRGGGAAAIGGSRLDMLSLSISAYDPLRTSGHASSCAAQAIQPTGSVSPLKNQ